LPHDLLPEAVNLPLPGKGHERHLPALPRLEPHRGAGRNVEPHAAGLLALELQRRISYVKAVEVAGVQIRTAAALRPIIEKIAGVIHDDRTPSVSTVRRWIIFYEASGKDVRSLVPATKARGNRQRRFFGQRLSKGDFKNDPKAQERANKVAELLDNSIDEVYLKDQRFTVDAVYDALLVKIEDANRFRDHDDQLPEPSKSSVYDAVSKLDDYEVIAARYGKKIADEKYRAVLQGPRPTRPLRY